MNVEVEVRNLLARGKKLDAIKLVKQYTALGLLEAKGYVEAIEAGQTPPYVLPEVEVSQTISLSSAVEAEVQDLVARRDRIEAIKLVMQHTGRGLKEAKEYVDMLSAGISPLRASQEMAGSGQAANPASAVKAKVRDLLAQGKKVEAVMLVREYAVWGLREAKEYVDALSEGKPPVHSLPEIVETSQAASLSAAIEAEVRDLLARGKKIEAIKLVRQHTGWGLKEAKNYVDEQE